MHAVRDRRLGGVICGHIHSAAIRDIGGLIDINCGDWVDGCTAIVEHDGRGELVYWIAKPSQTANPQPERRPRQSARSSRPSGKGVASGEIRCDGVELIRHQRVHPPPKQIERDFGIVDRIRQHAAAGTM